MVQTHTLIVKDRKMLSELYHTCTAEEKEVSAKYLSNLEDIVHTTSI